ncbi:hypothetical protein BBFL7_02538 [Flavobacteria bacterium BBFL7]|nr:hypothetical protein BBFL7_02538 [Flavobacteria bacterium BBFL7]
MSVEILNKTLVGNAITGFSISDWFCIYLHEYYLVCQNFTSPDELKLNQLLSNSYSQLHSSIDKEYIAKCTILAANMRKEIVSAEVNELSEITICFNNGSDLVIKTNESIVDWQWCINKTGKDPYDHNSLLACFWPGEIEQNA